jgi:transcriptional regulator with XRE-family HTH domain
MGGRQSPIAGLVVANVRALRAQRRWSTADLAKRLPDAVGLSRSTLANLETDRRDDVSVDELAGLAEAFGYPDPWALTLPIVPPCPRCAGDPPHGFSCQLCGAPEVTDGR